jgi:hypothetical protein
VIQLLQRLSRSRRPTNLHTLDHLRLHQLGHRGRPGIRLGLSNTCRVTQNRPGGRDPSGSDLREFLHRRARQENPARTGTPDRLSAILKHREATSDPPLTPMPRASPSYNQRWAAGQQGKLIRFCLPPSPNNSRRRSSSPHVIAQRLRREEVKPASGEQAADKAGTEGDQSRGRS